MSFFRKHRPDDALQAKVRAVFSRAMTSTQLVACSSVVFVCSVWCFAVAYWGWPSGWDRFVYAMCLFVAPALGFAIIRELFCGRWGIPLVLAAVLSILGFALGCATTYFVINPRAHDTRATNSQTARAMLPCAHAPLGA
jgi:hypothetical protein